MRATLGFSVVCVVGLCLLGISSVAAASATEGGESGVLVSAAETRHADQAGGCLPRGTVMPAAASDKFGTLSANLECAGAPETKCGGGLQTSFMQPASFPPQSKGSVLAVFVVPAQSATAVEGEGCVSSSPTQLPWWTVSGAWDGAELLLVDAAANRIVRYSAEGRALGPMDDRNSLALGPFQPSAIAERDFSLVIQLTGGRMVFLGPDRSIREQREIFRESAGSTGSIEAIHQWAVAGDDLVLCGDVKLSTSGRSEEAEWVRGFVRVPLTDPAGFMRLRLFDSLGDPGQVFCRLGFPYIASIGDTAYFLVMDEQPTIYRAAPGSKIVPLPAVDLPVRPKLPGLVTPQDFVTTYRLLEHETLPTGLLAWENRLFLLMREPTLTATRWTLREIDPTTGSEVGRAEIPSSAHHLMVVPGDRQWLFVEKGPVLALGEQKVERFLHVGAGSIRRIRSSRNLCSSVDARSVVAP